MNHNPPGRSINRRNRLVQAGELSVEVPKPGAGVNAEAIGVQGEFIRDVINLNPSNFPEFSPDETSSICDSAASPERQPLERVQIAIALLHPMMDVVAMALSSMSVVGSFFLLRRGRDKRPTAAVTERLTFHLPLDMRIGQF